jgi:DNA-damage-inducible protein J
MEMVSINIQASNDLIEKAEAVCRALGLEISTAVNMFLHQVVNHRGIPFEVKAAEPLYTPEEGYIVPPDPTKRFEFGSLKGKIFVPDDFCEPLEDLMEYMY